jgi:hypothetical protein
MEQVKKLHIGEDNTIRWDGLHRNDVPAEHDDYFVNDATITWELKDAAAAVVADGDLEYVPSSDGDYGGTLEKAQVTLVERSRYTLELTAVAGGFDGFRKIPCVAMHHGAED